MTYEKKPLIQAAGFWLKEGPKGKYLSGKIDGVPVLVFNNEKGKAKNPKAPDRIMFWADTPPKWFVDPQQKTLDLAETKPKVIQEDDFNF
jgi:hypothetical protein